MYGRLEQFELNEGNTANPYRNQNTSTNATNRQKVVSASLQVTVGVVLCTLLGWRRISILAGLFTIDVGTIT